MSKTSPWLAATLLAAGATISAPALSQSSMQFEPAVRTPYIGGSIGINDDEESVWRVLGGYQVHRNLAVELGYTDLGDMTVGGRPAEANAWELVGVGLFPLNESFSLLGKLGAYRGEAEGGGLRETRTDLTYGLGAEYNMNRNLGLRLEWQRYTDFGGGAFGSRADQDILSLGAIYRFR